MIDDAARIHKQIKSKKLDISVPSVAPCLMRTLRYVVRQPDCFGGFAASQ